MGGEPFLALNLAALPPALPEEMIAQILRGSAEKAREAGCVIAGGHTVDDDEPKFGLAVLGTVHPQQVRTKAAARPGDMVLLTKPLGVGLIATAAKAGEAQLEHMAVAVEWMKRLNKGAAAPHWGAGAARCNGYHRVRPFGPCLGGGQQERGTAALTLRWLAVSPRSDGLCRGIALSGGGNSNMADYGEHVSFASRLEYEMQLLCFCPETSGGLLITLPQDQAEAFLARYQSLGQEAWVIGEVLEGTPSIEVT